MPICCSCCSSDDFTGPGNRPNVVVEKMTSGILVASMAGTCETSGPEFGCTQQVKKVIMKDNLEKMLKQTKNNSNFTFSTVKGSTAREALNDVCKIKPPLNFSFRLHFTVAVKNSCCQVFVKDINQDKPSLLGF